MIIAGEGTKIERKLIEDSGTIWYLTYINGNCITQQSVLEEEAKQLSEKYSIEIER